MFTISATCRAGGFTKCNMPHSEELPRKQGAEGRNNVSSEETTAFPSPTSRPSCASIFQGMRSMLLDSVQESSSPPQDSAQFGAQYWMDRTAVDDELQCGQTIPAVVSTTSNFSITLFAWQCWDEDHQHHDLSPHSCEPNAHEAKIVI